MKALLIHNPRAGNRNRQEGIRLAASRLSEAGWEVDIAPPEPGAADRLLHDSVRSGLEAAVVVGGDGSLNLAIQSLAGTSTALGVIPTGTANVWAREVGIPLDVRGATNVLLTGQIVPADLGQANGRYFLSMAGVGLDATITRIMKPDAKRRLGMMAYVVAALVEAVRLRGQEAVLSANGRTVRRRVLMIAACNTRLYGGVLTMAPGAFLDDGLLDVSVFHGRGLRAKARHAIKALFGRHPGDPEVEFFQADRLRVKSRDPLPVQVDGDYLCTTPVEIRAVPRALRVIVPPGARPQFREIGDRG